MTVDKDKPGDTPTGQAAVATPATDPDDAVRAAKAARKAALKSRPRWQKIFGLKRRPGKRVGWGLTIWGMMLVTLLVMGGGMAGFAEYSMTPDFCRSCHIMEPYFQAWHQSTHKNVACPECHFEPGMKGTLYGKFQASSQAVKYITQTYGSKPHAEIKDVSCMREGCHETRILKDKGKVDWVIERTDEVTGLPHKVTVKFDHTPHLTQERLGKQLRCVSCHSQIVQGRHIVVTTDTCFLCHFKGLKHGRDDQTRGTCKGCHDAPKTEIRLATGTFRHEDYAVKGNNGKGVLCQNCHADTVRGDGAVPQQVCWNCHNQTTQIARFGETGMLHKEHITNHKVECSSCHVQIEHSLMAGSREEKSPHSKTLNIDAGSCGMCHEQMHLGPREMFRGIGGRGVAAMPSPMSRARVNCIACHTQKQKDDQSADVAGQTFVASQERCDYCHNEKYKGTLDDWKKTIATNLAQAETRLAVAQVAAAQAKLSPEATVQLQRLLDDAAFNVRFVKLGRGVHNVNYATALLSSSVQWCDQAQTLMKASPPPAVKH